MQAAVGTVLAGTFKIRFDLSPQVLIDVHLFTTRQAHDRFTQMRRSSFNSAAFVNEHLDTQVEMKATLTVWTTSQVLLDYCHLFGT